MPLSADPGQNSPLLFSNDCSKAHWKEHKKGCAIQCKLNEINDAMEKKEKAEAASGKKPRRDRCTGCNQKLREVDSDGEEYDDEDADDQLEPPDQVCPDCGYVACESCSCHNSRGESRVRCPSTRPC